MMNIDDRWRDAVYLATNAGRHKPWMMDENVEKQVTDLDQSKTVRSVIIGNRMVVQSVLGMHLVYHESRKACRLIPAHHLLREAIGDDLRADALFECLIKVLPSLPPVNPHALQMAFAQPLPEDEHILPVDRWRTVHIVVRNRSNALPQYRIWTTDTYTTRILNVLAVGNDAKVELDENRVVVQYQHALYLIYRQQGLACRVIPSSALGAAREWDQTAGATYQALAEIGVLQATS